MEINSLKGFFPKAAVDGFKAGLDFELASRKEWKL